MASQSSTTPVENFVHEPTQVHDGGIDLTVSAVYEVSAPGRVDFGGDELQDADLEPVPTTSHDPGDTYEWWHLDGGQYVLQYNEFLATDEDTPLFLQPRNELLARGVTHPSVRVGSHLPLVSVTVPDGGIEIKENARVSTLVGLDDRSTDAADAPE
ncbi:dCTP deaminase [Halovivax cerinus]|uniref:dCTP deaminase n=1 Tax=Halovivax cerinus TaxID=1487865 RepID=A0ABD5NJR2_9EURY|nr:dCTP deaminase [Halovivax cerinus]